MELFLILDRSLQANRLLRERKELIQEFHLRLKLLQNHHNNNFCSQANYRTLKALKLRMK